MLYNYLRVIHSDNGSLADLSLDNQENSINLGLGLVQSEDYIYLGQYYPFNNFFIQVNTPNEVVSNLAMEYWAGPSIGWKSAIDILDGTSTSGKTMAKSGVVQFSPDFEHGWTKTIKNPNTTNMPVGIENLKIYHIYWLRLKVSASLTSTTAVKRFCYAFTRSQQLKEIDTEVNQYLASFDTNKTNWDDEIITASTQVLSELRRKGLVVHQGQILRFDDVSMATDYKTLELIYENLGESHEKKMLSVHRKFENCLANKRFTFDTDEDGEVDEVEINNRVRRLVR